MKDQEIKLITDLYKHFQPQTDVTDELIKSCFDQYGSIRGVLMNLVLKFQPNADVTDEYLDKKLTDYGLQENTTEEINQDPPEKVVEEKQAKAPKEEAPQSEEITPVEKDTKVSAEKSASPKDENSKDEVSVTPEKKNSVLKWGVVVLVFLGLGYFCTNLYFQNTELESSLKETKDLYQQELDENIVISEKKPNPIVKSHRSQVQKTYAKSNASNLNVRSTPAITDNIIDMLQLGDVVEVLDTVRFEIEPNQQALLNQETLIEIEGKEILFKKGKALKIINKVGTSSYRVIVDERNNEAIISENNLDIVDKEIWLKIKLNNQQEGYVYQRFLNSEISDEADTYDYYEVYNTYKDQKSPYLNLRSEPNNNSTNIARMYDGTRMVLLSKGNGNNRKWMEVRVLNTGEVGYAHSKWIRTIDEN